MDVVLFTLFMMTVYSVIGYMSSSIFQDWCWHLFNHNWELGKAVGTITAMFWPIGWPAIIVVGMYHAVVIICKCLFRGIRKIHRSFKIVAQHFRQAEQGEQ